MNFIPIRAGEKGNTILLDTGTGIAIVGEGEENGQQRSILRLGGFEYHVWGTVTEVAAALNKPQQPNQKP
jgi:hypothetical protein